MIKVGLIDDDKTKAADELKYSSEPFDTESPYKYSPRTTVKYYERPEKIQARLDAFRNLLGSESSNNGAEIARLVQHMREDYFIDDTFSSQLEDHS